MKPSSFLNDFYSSSSSSDDEISSSGSDNDGETGTSRSRKRSSGESHSNSHISFTNNDPIVFGHSSRRENIIYKLLNREV